MGAPRGPRLSPLLSRGQVPRAIYYTDTSHLLAGIGELFTHSCEPQNKPERPRSGCPWQKSTEVLEGVASQGGALQQLWVTASPITVLVLTMSWD